MTDPMADDEIVSKATLATDETETPKKDYSQNDQAEESTDDNETFEKKRFKEIVEGKQKEVATYKELALDSAVKAAEANANTLKELHEKNPDLAKEAAEKFNREKSERGNYENFLKDKKPKASKTYTEEDIDKKVEKRLAEKEHERAITKAEKMLEKLSEELQETAKERFEKIIAGKTLTEEEAIEYADMVISHVNKDRKKEEKFSESLARAASSDVSRSKTSTDDEMVSTILDGKLILVPKNG